MAYISKVKIDVTDIADFVHTASSFTQDINLSQKRAVVSAKSIMGIMSLNLSDEATLIIHDIDSTSPEVTKFAKWVTE